MSGDQRSVLIVGASRGIGAAIATAFRNQGDQVAATHRGSGVGVDGVHPIKMDITDAEQLEAGIGEVEQVQGAPEIVVVNAGITRDALLLRMSDDDLDAVIDTNLRGVMRVCRRSLKGMLRAKRGSILLVGSASARLGQAGQTNYAASKAGLEGFARSLAREYAGKNVRCNVVLPGPTDTDMTAGLTEQQKQAMLAQVPLGRFASPEEIADAVRWVADATFVTGAVIPVTGGAVMP